MNARACLYALAALIAGAPLASGDVTISSETGTESLIQEIKNELSDEMTPETVFEARRQARRGAEKAEAYLNSIGYFDAQVSYSVAAGPPIQPMIKIEPGSRFSIGEIAIDLGGVTLRPEDQRRLEDVQTLEPGEPVIAKKVVAQEAGLAATLRALGYGETEILDRGAIGDRADETVDLTFNFDPGARLRFGEVQFDPGTRTRRSYLERLIPFEAGEVYSPEQLSTFNRRLASTRMYSVSSARLDSEAVRISRDGDEVRDVSVTLTERERYSLAAGASFSTSEGVGLTSSLTRRNATRRGDTLVGHVILAEQQQGLEFDWRIPHAFAFDRSLAFNAELTTEDTDAYEREAATLTGALEVHHSSKLTYVLGAQSEFTREEDTLGQRDLQILSASAGARLDYSDDPLDPSKGWRADLRAEPALAVGDSESQFFTLNGQISAYYPLIGDRLIAAARWRNAFVYGASIDELPVSRRFFAGGGGSARGFEYQSVGPTDIDGVPTGGRGLMEFSGELRWRGTGNLGYVAFFDGAAVSTDQAPQFNELRHSAGLGVRYQTAVGPIRFDIATPIDREDGDDPVQIYVSIGQAF